MNQRPTSTPSQINTSEELTPSGSQVPRAPFNLQAGLLLFVLVILGYVGNYLNVELFLGVNFLFGSIATLTIVYFFGFRDDKGVRRESRQGM